MHPGRWTSTRRDVLASGLALAAGATLPGAAPASDRALIAISLDLEMSAQYPTRDQTHWNYEKGNLDTDTKRYAVEAARRVKASGGIVHFFAVGRTMEQEDVGWLRTIADQGHPVGNHTYDHVNVRAKRLEDLQFRFQRAPWLVEGRDPLDVVEENIRLTNRALKQRAGITADGFRTPGGFTDGLAAHPEVQALLLKLGFRWVSSKYPVHPHSKPGQPPDKDVLAGIVSAQREAQPFVYPSGLVEVPMSPISDVSAFRTGRWGLDAFLEAVRLGVGWAIEHRAVFDLLAHPSCLVVADPEFKTVDLVCDMVRAAGERASIVDLGTIARRVATLGADGTARQKKGNR
ncbi:MAG: polysaccharide deacetylase family protein [Isosphaeraceae bacterium]|nr:polysaccharide deacetylase family protein [Isosphaeraceae bacterium]